MTTTPERGGALWVLGALAILAFAANSLFARAALADGATGPGVYAALRIGAGALVLLPLVKWREIGRDAAGGVMLALYAAGFAFAYVRLDAASGALILFTMVQASVLVGGRLAGGTVGVRGLVGVMLALAGVALLLAPGAASVDGRGAALMAAAGVGWGVYTLIGRASGRNAAALTAGSFLVAALLLAPLLLLDEPVGRAGAIYAILSGAVTSGLGYVAWYRIAPSLSLSGVAAVQLATPLAAAVMAWPLLGEAPTGRLVLAGAIILGGIWLAMKKPRTTD
ncbi:DMT family transporter [Sphingomicrobium sp. XHP0235]|uniref:DMT family transporter n=1 Tax=Sphingomicrobium aquimarinum TaxID=3133971 RepID=UPI0031FF1F4D